MRSSITIRQVGLDKAAARLREMAARARDVSPAMRDWGQRDVRDAFEEQFSSEGVRLTGKAWEPLSPRYAAWKNKHFPGQPILRRTGEMEDLLVGVPMNIERVTRNSGEFGASSRILGYHQRGTHNQDGSVKMPARPVVRLTEDMTASLTRRIMRHITHGDL